MWSKQRTAPHLILSKCCIVTLVMDFVKSFLQFVCYSSVGRDELNGIYRIRNSGMQGRFEIKSKLKNCYAVNKEKIMPKTLDFAGEIGIFYFVILSGKIKKFKRK